MGKCTNCAFKQGFEIGILERNTHEITLELVEKPTKGQDFKQKQSNVPTNIDFIEKEISFRSQQKGISRFFRILILIR